MSAKKQEAQTNASATGLPLFYKNPVLLDSAKHGGMSLKQDIGFGFAEGVNAVPVNMIELPQIAHFYPIAFSNDDTATPVAVLGVRNNENLFLDKKGQWVENAYIPAYIRRYPFIFTELNEGKQLSLCVDDTDGIFDEGDANPFFDKEGNPSDLSKNALEFCRSYHTAARQTLDFSKEIAESGILVDRQAEFNVDGKERINFSGFKIVDEKKLSELPEATIAKWHKNGTLGAVYAHLFSGMHWATLSRMLNEKLKK